MISPTPKPVQCDVNVGHEASHVISLPKASIMPDVDTATAVTAVTATAAIPAAFTPLRFGLRARKESKASPSTTPSRRNKRAPAAGALTTRDTTGLFTAPQASNGSAHSTTNGNGNGDHHHHHHHRHHQLNMASAAGKWREEQVLIICPGSRTTMAQLGCGELTPPMHRLPTRMFRDGDEWRPYYTFRRTKMVDGVEQEEWVEDVDGDTDAVWPIEGMEKFSLELGDTVGELGSFKISCITWCESNLLKSRRLT